MTGIAPFMKFAFMSIMAIALLAGRARAQFDDLFHLRIKEGDFRRMLDKLPADTPHAVVLAYSRFADDYTREAERMRERRRQAERDRSDNGLLGIDWWDKRLELESRLASDVAAALQSDEQRVAWGRAVADERRRYVLKEMKVEQRLREPFDPVTALDSIELSADERTRAQPLIDAGVESLDQALRTWQRAHIDGLRLRTNTPYNSPDGPRIWKEVTDKWMGLNASVVAASENSARTIADALDPEHREAFLEGIDRQVYPEAFERCPAELAFEALGQVPGIAPEQRAALDAIYADYAPKRDDIRKQVIKVIRQYQYGDNPLKREMDELWAAVERGEVDIPERNRRSAEIRMKHPANALLQTRHDLGIETVRRMRAVFSADQIAHFPLAARLALTAW